MAFLEMGFTTETIRQDGWTLGNYVDNAKDYVTNHYKHVFGSTVKVDVYAFKITDDFRPVGSNPVVIVEMKLTLSYDD